MIDKTIPNQGRTDAIALIAYLQTIPTSKSQLRADSTLKANREKPWKNFVLSSDNEILNIAKDTNNIKNGRLLYLSSCSACHGDQGQGGIGPNLTDNYYIHGSSILDITRVIIDGVVEQGMISWRNHFKPQEIGSIVAYINSIKGTKPPFAKAPQGTKG